MSKSRNGKPARNDPRMNLAFYDDNLEFCQEMAWRNRLNTTQYINQLISAEKAKHDPADWKQPKDLD